jgi:hypothetical protein
MNKSEQLLEIKSHDELHSDRLLPPLIVGDQLSSLTILQLCSTKGVRHVVQRSNLMPDSETNVAQYMLEHPSAFIRYPISAILGNPNPSAESEDLMVGFKAKIDSPDAKLEIEELLQQYARQFKNPSSVIYDISIAADELITNALYNAPYVDEQNSKSGPTRNPSNINVDPLKKPEVFAGSDGVRLVIGVRDFYGRLNTAKLIQRIQGCYENNLCDQISYNDGGAGIGSFMVFDSCAGMYIAVDKGRSTTICCSFPVGLSASKRSAIPKNIHLLNLPDVEA